MSIRKAKKLIKDPRSFFQDALRNQINSVIKNDTSISTSGSEATSRSTVKAIGAIQEHLLACDILAGADLSISNADNRVYLITHVPFWKDALGNQKRIFELFRSLESRFDTYFIYTQPISFFDSKSISSAGISNKFISLINAESALSYENKHIEDDLADHRNHVLRGLLHSFIDQNPCRALVCEYIVTEPLIRNLDLDCMKIIDTHDIMSKRMKTYNANGRKHHINISEEEELNLLDQFDISIAIQEEEHDFLSRNLGNEKSLLCYHSVNIKSYFKERPVKRLAYVAGSNPANVDSMEWFLKRVWPSLSNLSLELHIFGSISHSLSKLSSVKKDVNIICHGEISKIEDVYLLGDLVINPVLYGGGLKIKTVEAMGYGIPSITTPEGAAGLSDCIGKAFLSANSPEEFSECIQRLVASSSLRDSLSKFGTDYANNNFTRNSCFDNLLDRISEFDLGSIKIKSNNETSSNKINEKLLVIGSKHFPLLDGISDFFDRFENVYFRNGSKFKTINGLKNLIRNQGVDRIFFLNPYINETNRMIYRWCRENDFPYLCFDRGGLPDSWFFDPKGFNSDSSSYDAGHWKDSFSSAQLSETQSYLRELVSITKGLEEQGDRVSKEKLKESLNIKGRKVLFVPFQRPNDTVVKYFSGSIESFDNFCVFINSLREFLPEKEWAIIGKTHPLENISPETTIKLADNSTNINDLLDISDAVLTINSGVGLLALAHNKPTYCAGDAYYSQAGLAEGVESPEALANKLSDEHKPEQHTILEFFTFLRKEFYSFGDSRSYIRTEEGGERSRVTREINFNSLMFNGTCLKTTNNHPSFDKKPLNHDQTCDNNGLFREHSVVTTSEESLSAPQKRDTLTNAD